MSSEDVGQLLSRIRLLERKLHEKEQDVVFFQNELEKVNQRLEQLVIRTQQELKLATKIHKALVPTEFPNIPGFEFSTKFLASAKSGGDYFDIFDFQRKMKFGGVLSSSSGYTLSALMMSVLLKYTGMRLLQDCKSADEAIKEMKSEIIDALQAGGAVSLVFFQINRKDYGLSLTHLGKAAVFYYNYAENELQVLPANGEEMSSEKMDKISSHSISLNSRDRLIICSPGFFELENLNDEQMSIEFLKSKIGTHVRSPVHELRNEVLYQAEQFASGREAPRDRTVLVLEVKDRVIKLAKG